ncbi:MAG: VanZ family protein [Armatimonadetes bacterium]|nr:VanZ family protein [Armatimonadota bacterium]
MSEAPSSPLPRRKPLWYWLPVLLWVGVMQYFSSAPNPYAGIGEGTTIIDFLGHLCGFIVLSLLVTRWWCFRMGERTGRRVLQAVAFCLAYALLDELHQIPIPGRSWEWFDLGTDTVGSTIGLGAALAWRALRRRAKA